MGDPDGKVNHSQTPFVLKWDPAAARIWEIFMSTEAIFKMRSLVSVR